MKIELIEEMRKPVALKLIAETQEDRDVLLALSEDDVNFLKLEEYTISPVYAITFRGVEAIK